MKNNTKLLISGQGTADTKNLGCNTSSVADSGKDNSKTSNVDFMISRYMLHMVIKSVVIIMEEEYKHNGKGLNKELVKQHSWKDVIKNSPFASLVVFDANGNICINDETPIEVIISAATYCVDDLVNTKEDEMYGNTFGKNICNITIPRFFTT